MYIINIGPGICWIFLFVCTNKNTLCAYYIDICFLKCIEKVMIQFLFFWIFRELFAMRSFFSSNLMHFCTFRGNIFIYFFAFVVEHYSYTINLHKNNIFIFSLYILENSVRKTQYIYRIRYFILNIYIIIT